MASRVAQSLNRFLGAPWRHQYAGLISVERAYPWPGVANRNISCEHGIPVGFHIGVIAAWIMGHRLGS
jgi:hypothetical protein